MAESRQKAQEDAAAEFQRKEDALEAQKAVLDELEKLRDKMQLSAVMDVSRKRFMEAHRTGGRTLGEIYQADIVKKQAQNEAFLRCTTRLNIKARAMLIKTRIPSLIKIAMRR